MSILAYLENTNIFSYNEDMDETENKSEEISLIDLLAVLLKHKKLIIVVTLISALLSLALAVLSLVLPPEKSFLPNKYTPKASMLISDSSSGGSNLSQYASLASLAGINLGSSGGLSYSKLASYIVTSNSYLDKIVDNFNLIEKWKIEDHVRASSRKALKKVLNANSDTDTGVFTISFKDIDPKFACEVVNYAVELLEKRFDELGIDQNKIKKENLEKNINSSFKEIERLQAEALRLDQRVYSGSMESIAMQTNKMEIELTAQKTVYTQLKSQYELLKVEMQSEKPILQVLEMAEVPDQKSEPSRGKLCIIITFAGFFLSVFLAFAKNAVENIKSDPEAMQKLSSGKKHKEKK